MTPEKLNRANAIISRVKYLHTKREVLEFNSESIVCGVLEIRYKSGAGTTEYRMIRSIEEDAVEFLLEKLKEKYSAEIADLEKEFEEL